MHEEPDRFTRSRAVIEDGIARGLHTGAQLYVSREGRVLIDAGFGTARPDVPMRPDTLTLWMSAGKPLGAVAIALLHERDQIDLDTPVAHYLADFAAGGKQAITVRHLLLHSGGFRAALGLRDDTPWEQKVATVCRARVEPGWVVGETVGYHPKTSWIALGALVEAIDGRPFGRFVREEICEPLGMHDTWSPLPAEAWDRYGDRVGWTFITDGRDPSGVAPTNGREAREAAASPSPGSNTRGPAHDLGRFYEMLLAGGEWGGRRILSEETVRQWTSVQNRGVFDKSFKHRMNWGLGFIVNGAEYGVGTIPYGFGPHASVATFGHGGRESAQGFADPAHGLAVVVVFNGMPGERRHQRRLQEICRAVYEDLGLRG